MKTPLTLPAPSAPHPQSGVNEPAPPWGPQETCENKSVSDTSQFLLLLRPHSGIPQKPVAFPAQGVTARPGLGGKPSRALIRQEGEVLRGHCREGDTPIQQSLPKSGMELGSFLILRRWNARCYWQLWRGRGVCAFWLQGQLETSLHMYKACLGKGQAPDDMVPRR